MEDYGHETHLSTPLKIAHVTSKGAKLGNAEPSKASRRPCLHSGSSGKPSSIQSQIVPARMAASGARGYTSLLKQYQPVKKRNQDHNIWATGPDVNQGVRRSQLAPYLQDCAQCASIFRTLHCDGVHCDGVTYRFWGFAPVCHCLLLAICRWSTFLSLSYKLAQPSASPPICRAPSHTRRIAWENCVI